MNVKRFVFYNVILLLVGYALVSALYVSVGTTANNISFQKKYAFSLLFPEGWGFFTKDARGKQLVLYQIQPRSKELQLVTYKSASAANWFGFSRKSRRTGMEFHRVLARVPDSCWVDGHGPFNFSKANTGPVIVIDSTALAGQIHYLNKGDYVIMKYDPVPWAWSNYQSNYTNKFKMANISIK